MHQFAMDSFRSTERNLSFSEDIIVYPAHEWCRSSCITFTKKCGASLTFSSVLPFFNEAVRHPAVTEHGSRVLTTKG